MALGLLQSGAKPGRQQDFDKAISDFAEAVRLIRRTPPFGRTSVIRWHISSERTLGATRKSTTKPSEITATPSVHPELALFYFNRGFAWSKKQDFAKAVSDYNEALRLDQKGIGVLLYLTTPRPIASRARHGLT